MRSLTLIQSMLILSSITYSQIVVRGKVLDNAGKPVSLVNVYLKDIYDGSITNEEGVFSFTAKVSGNVTLCASAIGFKPYESIIDLVLDSVYIEIRIQPEAKNLGEVIVSAGSFEVSDKKRGVILRPLDIVTTAGASGDIYGALQTLPGVAPLNNETGLFVRGGAAHETKTIVDGMIVANPFFGDAPDVSQRARFSPFGFTGMVFSTGGYSAEYGQALSSVLVLNSNNEVESNIKSISLSAAGATVAYTKSFKNKKTLFGELNYSNLRPLYNIIPQNRDWVKPPEGLGFTTAYISKSNANRLLRIQARYQQNSIALNVPDLSNTTGINLFSNRNHNFTSYASFSQKLAKEWNMMGGLSVQNDNQDRSIGADIIPQKDFFVQLRTAVNKRLNKTFNFKTGAELQYQAFQTSFNQIVNSYKQINLATFSETDIKITKRLIAKTGIRPEYSRLNNSVYVSPRLAMAFKTGVYSQLSIAYGHYYQNPENQFYARNNKLLFEKATHYILNYQWLTETYTFRTEVYFKSYDKLVTYKNDNGNFIDLKNNGIGFAKGIDLFWRDNKGSIKNFDYWLSYGYIKSERISRNLNFNAIPAFAPEHTVNIVTKYEIPKIRVKIGSTFTYSTGRSFYNPISFQENKTKDFQNLNLSFSHITTLFRSFTVIYFSLNNVLNTKNVLNFRYSIDGLRTIEVPPPVFRSFFAGMNMRF